MQISSQTMWNEPPPHDPVGDSRSKEIDKWLLRERIKHVSEESRTLIVCPEGYPFEKLRDRVMAHLGDQVELSDGRLTKVSTDQFTKSDKKRMNGLEPTVLLFLVGLDGSLTESEMLMKMTKAMAHFLFISKHLGLSENCVVTVHISQYQAIARFARAATNAEWSRLFPALQRSASLKDAIAEEFETVACHTAHPLAVNTLFDDSNFENLDFLRGVIQEAHGIVLSALEARIGAIANANESFHDASAGPVQRDQIVKISEKSGSERISGILSGILFVIQVILFLTALTMAIPWDAIITFAYFILDMLHIPKLF